MNKIFIIASVLSLVSVASFAGQVGYCTSTALAGAEAIAKVNNPTLTDKDFESASVALLNPADPTKFEVKVSSMTFAVTTVELDGDCFVGSVILTEW